MNRTKTLIATTLTVLLASFSAHAATATKTTTTKTKTTKSTTKTAVKTKSKGNPLLDPSKLKAKAPAVFTALFDTSKGSFSIEVHRDWSPNGADRFYNLVSNGYFNEVRFFRVISGFMAQFGINGNPAVNDKWQDASIADDPVKQSNTRGMVSFAMRGPGSRTTQLFINYSDGNARLDGMGFSPFGKVVSGMSVVDALYSGYGEGAPSGRGPDQGRVQSEGNKYLAADFPQLDWIKSATIVKK